MLLLTLLTLCAETITCPECLEIAKTENAAHEWDKHTRDSANYANQLHHNSAWRRKKHPRHAQKAIAKATNTTTVAVPVTVNNTNNSSNNNSNVISVSNTTAPAATSLPASTPTPAPIVTTPAPVSAPTPVVAPVVPAPTTPASESLTIAAKA